MFTQQEQPNDEAETTIFLEPKEKQSSFTRVMQWPRNIARLLISPLTQTMMAVGIFPAQTLSTLKKIPVLKSIINFVTRKIGNDPRTAAEVFAEDFGLNSKKSLETNNVKSGASKTDYITDFGRKVSLETFSFESNHFEKLSHKQKYYRLHCSGNAGNCSRFFPELAMLSQTNADLKTITYNHPGVEGSGGVTMTQDDLVNALYAQVKNLLNKGVPAKNIELTGFSIGAATAALTAQKLKSTR